MNYMAEIKNIKKTIHMWRARKESNPEPPEPKSGALSS